MSQRACLPTKKTPLQHVRSSHVEKQPFGSNRPSTHQSNGSSFLAIQPSTSSPIIKVGKQQQHSTVLFDWRGRGLDPTDESSSSQKGTVMIGCVANENFGIDIATVPRCRGAAKKVGDQEQLSDSQRSASPSTGGPHRQSLISGRHI